MAMLRGPTGAAVRSVLEQVAGAGSGGSLVPGAHADDDRDSAGLRVTTKQGSQSNVDGQPAAALGAFGTGHKGVALVFDCFRPGVSEQAISLVSMEATLSPFGRVVTCGVGTGSAAGLAAGTPGNSSTSE